LTKRYGSLVAVDRLDLTVCAGEVYGFLGPNGAGKTTTLGMLAGLVRPTSGNATVLGARAGTPAALARLGVQSEGSGFYPYLSGRANLATLAAYSHAPTERIDAVLSQAGLSGRGGDKVKGYSLGMRGRLGVAAALLKDPEVLILDEPTNGLDPQGITEMRRLVRQLGEGERTVLLSSHLLGEVEQICDRVGVVSQGQLVTEGTTEELRGGAAGVVIRGQPLDDARAVAERLYGTDHVGETDGALRVSVDHAETPTLNRELVAADVAVSELRPVERSLEDVFFELTGSEGG
jgi:ABC-2 type transport system ATP-binding protein